MHLTNQKRNSLNIKKLRLKMCPGQESNLHVRNGHQPLKLACLPIPPPGRGETNIEVFAGAVAKVRRVFLLNNRTEKNSFESEKLTAVSADRLTSNCPAATFLIFTDAALNQARHLSIRCRYIKFCCYEYSTPQSGYPWSCQPRLVEVQSYFQLR